MGTSIYNIPFMAISDVITDYNALVPSKNDVTSFLHDRTAVRSSVGTPQVPRPAVRSSVGTPQVPRPAVRIGAEIDLLSLRLSVSQGAS